MRSILYTISAFVLSIIAVSCISDSISTSPSHLLTFSTDTVSFDTVFTDLGTPTARLRVFNRNKQGVIISSIRFRNPSSNFSVNVDGVSGSHFSDVEIRGNDSIYLFLECFIPETGDKSPQLVEDELVFVTNGVEQTVLVEAWGQNVIRLRNKVVEKDITLTSEMPYIVFDSLTVAPGATLKIEPGTQLLFHDKASLVVKGTLEAVGSCGRMIDMRGDRLDNVLPDVGYDILAGQWKGIRFAPESYHNRMEYVDMRSTQKGVVVDSCGVVDQPKLTLLNSWLHNSQESVLTSTHAKVNAYGCVFSEAADAVVALKGGVHEFIQCTIANYYLFSAISQSLLSLYHLFPEDERENPMPLMRASFENTIIYGLGTDLNVTDLSGSDVFMRYVLLKSNGSDDDNFIKCIWGEDPLFYTVREDYIFNYHLREGSPAIDAGDRTFIRPEFQYDMDGLDRLAAPAPALGAFVYKKAEDSK